ncbi:hypothetical protein F4824DRAFT_97138 [Ustulina deusta]|nr:hypothetical protein F4824DRAFT_97138 [Ustulina deusta]
MIPASVKPQECRAGSKSGQLSLLLCAVIQSHGSHSQTCKSYVSKGVWAWRGLEKFERQPLGLAPQLLEPIEPVEESCKLVSATDNEIHRIDARPIASLAIRLYEKGSSIGLQRSAMVVRLKDSTPDSLQPIKTPYRYGGFWIEIPGRGQKRDHDFIALFKAYTKLLPLIRDLHCTSPLPVSGLWSIVFEFAVEKSTTGEVSELEQPITNADVYFGDAVPFEFSSRWGEQ